MILILSRHKEEKSDTGREWLKPIVGDSPKIPQNTKCLRLGPPGRQSWFQQLIEEGLSGETRLKQRKQVGGGGGVHVRMPFQKSWPQPSPTGSSAVKMMPQSVFFLKARMLGCHVLTLVHHWLRAVPAEGNSKASLAFCNRGQSGSSSQQLKPMIRTKQP